MFMHCIQYFPFWLCSNTFLDILSSFDFNIIYNGDKRYIYFNNCAQHIQFSVSVSPDKQISNDSALLIIVFIFFVLYSIIISVKNHSCLCVFVTRMCEWRVWRFFVLLLQYVCICVCMYYIFYCCAISGSPTNAICVFLSINQSACIIFNA